MRAIVYKMHDAADKALQSGRMHWREWSKMITNLLQSIIDENVRSGFMHNDLHLENVVFDRDTYTLRTWITGVILDRVYMPKYTSNTDITPPLLQAS
jgi:predicted unusual protein kinase regulating ubiquinone biosynthesis (AarF/ABC1/UbiB family)